MNHFNYFSICRETKNNGKGFGIKQMIISFVLLTMVCAVIYIFFIGRVALLQGQIELLNRIKLTEEFNQQYTAAIQVGESVTQAKKEVDFLQSLFVYTETVDTGNDKTIEIIDQCIADKAQISRITVSGKQISLEGYVSSMDALTEIEKSFRATDCFESVLVSTIESEEARESLKMSCQLALDGGAVANENE